MWQNDCKVSGQLILFNGDVFKGEFKNNMRHHGVYFYKNGDIYEGFWEDDVKSGTGKLKLANG